MKRLAVAFLLLAATAAAGDLDALRRDYAIHYFTPAAHVNLAKALHDRGDRLRAFFILEVARRERFDAETFHDAFAAAFLPPDVDFDNSDAAEARLKAAIEADPNNAKLLHDLADIYISRSNWKAAEAWLTKEMTIAPDDFLPVAALAEVKQRNDESADAEALVKNWIAAHPTNPDALDLRIGQLVDSDLDKAAALAAEGVKLHPANAQLQFDAATIAQKKNDLAAAEEHFTKAALLAPESETIQGGAAAFFLNAKKPQLALQYYLTVYFLNPEFYDGEYAESRIRKLTSRPLIESANDAVAMLHDDNPVTRAEAVEYLQQHPIESKKIEQLLDDADLRAAGSAQYLAIADDTLGVARVRQSLASPAELVRYDALSALILHGGEAGRKAAEEYRDSGKESSEALAEMLSQLKPVQ